MSMAWFPPWLIGVVCGIVFSCWMFKTGEWRYDDND